MLAKADALLPALLRLACGPPARHTDPALGALVNLTHDPAAAASLRRLAAIPRVMDALRDDEADPGATSVRGERRLGLLSNLTVEEGGAAALVGGGVGGAEGAGAGASAAGTANLARLLGAFLGGEAATDPVAPLLTNLTRTPAGRALLLDSRGGGLPGGLAAAASQLLAAGASPTRRAGCAAVLRNCCRAAAQAQAAAEEEEEEEVGEEGEDAAGPDPATVAARLRAGTARMGAVLSPAVLRPALVALCGAIPALDPEAGAGGAAPATPPDPEEGVREALAEAVLALAGTAPGRAALWEVAAPEALRVAYVEEEGPYVCEAMEKTARLFLENAGGVEEVEKEVEKEEGAGAAG